MSKKLALEQTLVLVKPDGVKRGLVGEVISRFEKVGLQLAALKVVKTPKDLADQHYRHDQAWMEKVGAKMRAFYLELGYDQGEEELLKLSDQDLGSLVETWSKDYLMEGKIVAMVWSGYQAVATIRKMVGSTFPNEALPGTIRGDFSMDSSAASSSAKRSTRNIVHASGNLEEARQEIELWFKNNEICLD